MNDTASILIIDDDKKITSMLRRSLIFAGFAVRTAADGAEGLQDMRLYEPGMVILDVMMPGMDGWEICRRMREGGSTAPMLMLTAKDEVQDRVKGLNNGADDYLVKPFALEELIARVRALLRRRGAHTDGSHRLTFADIVLDLHTREVQRDGKQIDLTAKEFELLHLFMQNPRRVLPRDMIMEKIWGYDYNNESNVLEVYIAMLRQKIEEHGGKRIILTVRGTGYVLRGDS